MKRDIEEAELTAYALGELDERERARVERAIEESADGRRQVEETRAVAESVREAFAAEHGGLGGELGAGEIEALEARARASAPQSIASPPEREGVTSAARG